METWNITITSPMGETNALLQFEINGTKLGGEMTGKGGSGPIEAGKIRGDQITWTCRIQKPVPMALKFSGARQGDDLSGTVKFGVYASGRFIAKRV